VLPFCDARAAGHAHIVDDSDVETPGVCHIEGWTTNFLNGDGYANASPACTMKSMPMLEIGFGYQHFWGQFIRAPLFGPQFKWKFTPVESGVGFGVGLNAGVNLTTGDLGTGSLIALVSLPVTSKVTFHFNAGWSYVRYVESQNAVFYGAQFEAKIRPDLLLMIEGFGRSSGDNIGTQVGLRYTPEEGPIDFDLLIGSFFDLGNPTFITFGVTVRF